MANRHRDQRGREADLLGSDILTSLGSPGGPPGGDPGIREENPLPPTCTQARTLGGPRGGSGPAEPGTSTPGHPDSPDTPSARGMCPGEQPRQTWSLARAFGEGMAAEAGPLAHLSGAGSGRRVEPRVLSEGLSEVGSCVCTPGAVPEGVRAHQGETRFCTRQPGETRHAPG